MIFAVFPVGWLVLVQIVFVIIESNKNLALNLNVIVFYF